MTPLLTLSTEQTEISQALDSLAPLVEESSIRVAVKESVERGAWVRFRFTLRDGSSVWEGAGRCDACLPINGSGAHELVLTELSFDPRNEVFFERLLLFGAKGPRTGPHKRLPDEVQPIERPRTPPAPAPRKPIPPPPAKLSTLNRTQARPLVRREEQPPPRAAAIAVSEELLERASTLARRLNVVAPSLARGRWSDARVVETALRMGIESLEGLTRNRHD